MSSRNKRIGIEESAYFGVVITGLQIVELSLSVVGLSARPIYTPASPTKSEIWWGYLQLISGGIGIATRRLMAAEEPWVMDNILLNSGHFLVQRMYGYSYSTANQ